MTATIKKQDPEEREYTGLSTPKMLLWFIIISSIMLFASFVSAYIVRRGDGKWLQFDIPSIFLYSTMVIVLSSVTMQWAYFAASRDELKQLKAALFATLLGGLAFCTMQWLGWKELVASNIHFVGNPSESFFYVISGIHLLHMAGGIIFLLVVIVKTFQFNVHKKSLLSINMCTTYWHFLGAAWIFLYFFLLLNR